VCVIQQALQVLAAACSEHVCPDIPFRLLLATIRHRLLKIGVVIVRNTRRVRSPPARIRIVPDPRTGWVKPIQQPRRESSRKDSCWLYDEGIRIAAASVPFGEARGNRGD